MSLFKLSLDQLPPPGCRGGVISIGNFDGVHLGHQALVAEATRQANLLPGPTVAVTFDPHPLQLLRPETFQPLLTTLEQRAQWLERSGADHVVALQTTPALLQLSAHDFFRRLVIDGLDARGIVEGFNFFFGKGREGDVAALQRLSRAAGRSMIIVPPVELDGKPVSSSRVRDALLAGQVSAAATMLGRPFRISGVVGLGQQRGQTLGFPTANLQSVENIVPGDGVYAVIARHNAKAWPAAANIGANPTFGEQKRKIEVHLIGFAGDLYGQVLDVDFMAKLRDTRSFASAADLVQQLRIDIEQATQALRQSQFGSGLV